MTVHNAQRGRFWHRIRHNKTARLPTRFIAVDTETIADEVAPTIFEHRLKFGCALYWDSPNGKRKHPKREGIVFDDVAVFWDWVDAHTKPRTRTIFSAHNLAFDFMILRGIDQLHRRGWSVEFPITSGARFISTARKGSRTLLLLDTMNFIPTSLAELGESLGLKKGIMPKDNAPLESWVKYCQRDVCIVELFWRRLLDFLRANDFGSFGLTAAALTFKIYRHAFLTHKIVVHPIAKVLKLERAALKGGRNECYQLGTLPRQKYHLVDVNSLYPSVMCANSYPTLLAFHGASTSVDRLRSLSPKYFVIARVGIETPEPTYPVTMRGKLVFPIGRFETTLTSPELDHALRLGRVQYVAEFAAYEQAPIFQTFAATLYAKRLEYKAAGNQAFSLMCKLLMNSLYGKFGQRGHVREELPNLKHIRFGYERMYSSKLRSEVNVTYWNGKGIAEYEQGESFDSFPAIAAAVTAYGRVALWEYMGIAGRDHVFYCDTDSLVVDDVGLERLTSYLDLNRLGYLKLEKTTRDVTLRGKKDYTLGKVTKIKGIKRTARRVDFRIFDQEHFSTLLETIRAGRSSGVTVTTQRKVLRRVYDAGVLGAGGTVDPIAVATF